MFVRFLGAIGTVTGSMAELYHPESNSHFLVDCGMMQGESYAEVPNWMEEPFPFKPEELDFVVLTHAHLDHIGLIPKLIREGFDGEIWCTEATKELTRLSLEDSMKIMGAKDAKEVLGKLRFHVPDAGFLTKRLALADGLSITFLRNAHILGACSVQISWKQDDDWQSIAFSGDIGINHEDDAPLPLLGGRQPPYPAEYAVLESTYGDTQRKPLVRDERLEAFRDLARAVVEENRIIILPSFAIQRAQDVLFDLHHALFGGKLPREIPLVVHSPMMQRASRIFAKHLCETEFKDRANLDANALRYLWTNLETADVLDVDPFGQREELQYLTETAMVGSSNVEPAPSRFADWGGQFKRLDNPDVDKAVNVLKQVGGFVVASAGMCDNGPVVGYLEKLLSEERTTVALTGFCAPGTAGATLLRVASLSQKQRAEIADEQVLEFGEGVETTVPLSKIKSDIFRMPYYSGHTDQEGIIDWFTSPFARVDAGADVTAFIVHGNEEGRNGLRNEVRHRLDNNKLPGISKLKTILPSDIDAWYDLGNGAAVSPSAGLSLSRRATPKTPLDILIPPHDTVSPNLERAIELDLVEPLRRAVAEASEDGPAFDMDSIATAAFEAGAVLVAKWAVSKGASIENLKSFSRDILKKWSREDGVRKMQLLLDHLTFSTDVLTQAVEVAVDHRNWRSVELLLSELKNHTPSRERMSYLLAMALMRYESKESFSALLEFDIDPDFISPNGLSLLHIAAVRPTYPNRIEALLKAGADPVTVTPETRQTPLHLAAIGVNFNGYEHWVGSGGEPSDHQKRDHWAKQVAEPLLEVAPGLVAERDAYERSAIHYAASLGAEELSTFLATKSPESLSHFDKHGWSPCDLARCHGHEKLAAKLEPKPGSQDI